MVVPFQASYSECSWWPSYSMLYYHNGIPYFPCSMASLKGIWFLSTEQQLTISSADTPSQIPIPPTFGTPITYGIQVPYYLVVLATILLTYNIPTWCLFYIDWTLHKGGEKMCPVIAASIAPGTRYQGTHYHLHHDFYKSSLTIPSTAFFTGILGQGLSLEKWPLY